MLSDEQREQFKRMLHGKLQGETSDSEVAPSRIQTASGISGSVPWKLFFGLFMFVLVAVLLIGVIGVFIGAMNATGRKKTQPVDANKISGQRESVADTSAAAAKERAKAAQLAAQAANSSSEIDKNPVVVEKSIWKAGGFGSVGLWEVTFRNRSNKPVGNLKFKGNN